jgi:hypothetical protein
MYKVPAEQALIVRMVGARDVMFGELLITAEDKTKEDGGRRQVYMMTTLVQSWHNKGKSAEQSGQGLLRMFLMLEVWLLVLLWDRSRNQQEGYSEQRLLVRLA